MTVRMTVCHHDVQETKFDQIYLHSGISHSTSEAPALQEGEQLQNTDKLDYSWSRQGQTSSTRQNIIIWYILGKVVISLIYWFFTYHRHEYMLWNTV